MSQNSYECQNHGELLGVEERNHWNTKLRLSKMGIMTKKENVTIR